MRTRIAAVTALAGSLLLVPLMQGPTQAGAPDLKSAVGTTHNGAITLIREGGRGRGGGVAVGGGEGVGGRMGGRDLSGGGRSFSEPKSDRGPRFGGREGGRFAGDRDRDDRDFHFRHGRHGHFVGGVWVWDYGPYAYNDCDWLRHQATISGSPYWWHRYRACLGY